jgi:hypothetical protein
LITTGGSGCVTLWTRNGLVHLVESEPSGHEWTVCKRYMTRAPDRDYYPNRRTCELVTCLFCMTRTPWQ